MTEWKPISKASKASKDGRLLIVLERGDRIYLASWWSGERCAEEAGHGKPEDYQAGWYTDDEEEVHPTHFMPYEPPPGSQRW